MPELYPSPGTATFRKFTLASGRTFEPNSGRGYSVAVHDVADELELVAEGLGAGTRDFQVRTRRLEEDRH
jgi:hypothetical protein